MTRKFFSGNNLEQAVMMAARHYGIEPEELAYREIEKRHGFLRTRKAVMIAVDPESPRRGPRESAPTERPEPARPQEAAPAANEAPADEKRDDSRDRPAEEAREPVAEPEPGAQADSWQATVEEPVAEPEAPADSWQAPVEEPVAVEPEAPDDSWQAPVEEPVAVEPEAPDDSWQAPVEEPAVAEPETLAAPPAAPERTARASEHDGELLEAAEKSAGILMAFAGIDAEASAASGEERVDVEIDGPDASLLVVEGGKGLLAIQHLLPRMLRGLTGRSSFVRVDSEGFHQKRKERLETLAMKEAEVASRTGRQRTLPPMAPDERRIVHLALQDTPGVETESRGTGLHKRVVIRPVTGDGGSDDIEARHGF